MDWLEKFAKGRVNRHKEEKVFDWDKAAKLIKESKSTNAFAGLECTWEDTADIVFSQNKPVSEEETYTYLSSTWDIPVLYLDDDFIDCYKMSSEVPEWNAKTYWPKSALKILEEYNND